jgi:hypothetical protein
MKLHERKTKAYNSLSFNWAYLISQQKILYFSVSNGERKMFLDTITPEIRIIVDFITEKIIYCRSILFVGFFWTISNDKRQSVEESLISSRLASRSFFKVVNGKRLTKQFILKTVQ